MNSRLRQHTWQPVKGPVSILTACEVVEPWPRTCSRIQNDYWILDYEFGPAGRCRVGSARAPWEPRPAATVHLYPPRAVYWEDSRRQRGRRHSAWVIFQGGDQAGFRRFLEHGTRYARFEDPRGELGERFRALAAVGQREGDAGFWTAQALFWQLVGQIQQAERVGDRTWRLPPPPGAVAPRFSGPVEAWLRRHLAEPVTVAQISGGLGISRSSLFQRLRHETGETPRGLLARLRVMEAKRLILQDLPLKQVAERVGFCDQFHLSKTFRRVLGVPPRALRRMRK